MTFFEEIATALDADGIESRVQGDTLFVPITSEVEIQFVEIDPLVPAANVYIATADDDWDADFEAVLVSVAFSVSDAVQAVASHIATDQVVTLLGDLLDGTDERIADLDFVQDHEEDNRVSAALGDNTSVTVTIEIIEGIPTAKVQFDAVDPEFEAHMMEAERHFAAMGEVRKLSNREVNAKIEEYASSILETCTETLDLGSFTDFDKLFDVLSLAADQAESWAEQLVPLDDDYDGEPDVYDLFGKDDDDEFFFDDDDEDDDDDDDEGE